MTTPLREVLARFTNQNGPLSVNQMAREMAIEPGLLRDMIDYWVRKGKLREVVGSSTACVSCGGKTGCPFIVAMPHYYELVKAESGQREPAAPPCACGSGHGGCH